MSPERKQQISREIAAYCKQSVSDELVFAGFQERYDTAKESGNGPLAQKLNDRMVEHIQLMRRRLHRHMRRWDSYIEEGYLADLPIAKMSEAEVLKLIGETPLEPGMENN
jgi:hypothetical protein